jgi:hypothetical protein
VSDLPVGHRPSIVSQGDCNGWRSQGSRIGANDGIVLSKYNLCLSGALRRATSCQVIIVTSSPLRKHSPAHHFQLAASRKRSAHYRGTGPTAARQNGQDVAGTDAGAASREGERSPMVNEELLYFIFQARYAYYHFKHFRWARH